MPKVAKEVKPLPARNKVQKVKHFVKEKRYRAFPLTVRNTIRIIYTKGE